MRARTKTIVGLDIEAGSLAAAEVASNGKAEILQTAVASLAPGLIREGEVIDPEGLAEALSAMFADHKLSKRVRVGLANQRVAVRPLLLPELESNKELEAAIAFRAQESIPMPIDQAVLDHQVVEHVVGENGARQVVAVAVAARRDMVAKILQALKGAGLRPVGVDLSAFGMIRALAGRDAQKAAGLLATHGMHPVERAAAAEDAHEKRLARQAAEADLDEAGSQEPSIPARLYCNLGDITNLAVARGAACLFTRVSTYGMEGVAQRLAERRELSLEHARQWLVHVGLEAPVETIEGDAETVAEARTVLEEGVTRLVEELRVSLEFYGNQERAERVAGVTVCGAGSAVPGLLARLESHLGLPFELGRAARLAHLDDALAARLTLPYGLALEE